MEPDTNATIVWCPVYEIWRTARVPSDIFMHLCKFLHCGGKKKIHGINSATKSLEWGAFLQPRLGVLVGPEAMEGGREGPV